MQAVKCYVFLLTEVVHVKLGYDAVTDPVGVPTTQS